MIETDKLQRIIYDVQLLHYRLHLKTVRYSFNAIHQVKCNRNKGSFDRSLVWGNMLYE